MDLHVGPWLASKGCLGEMQLLVHGAKLQAPTMAVTMHHPYGDIISEQLLAIHNASVTLGYHQLGDFYCIDHTLWPLRGARYPALAHLVVGQYYAPGVPSHHTMWGLCSGAPCALAKMYTC